MSVLPSTDTSGLNLAGPLQNALARLYQSTGAFNLQLASYSLPGYAAADVKKLETYLNSPLLSFCYLEKERIAVFLFDANRPDDFIVASQSLVDANGQPVLTNEWIEHQFRAAFAQVITLYKQNQFQPLPGSHVDSEQLAQEEAEDARKRAAESRRLFRELAQLEERNYYIGASVGMARFAGEGASTSTVDVGGFAGLKISDSMRLEGGVDVFSYALVHLDMRYHLPINEKYVSAALSLGVGDILTNVTKNLGYEATTLNSGQLLFGPGISFNIPLLGANIRGDLRFYLGGGSVLLGSYGLTYSL